MKQPYETDHIDPRWEEGREYQLVCGLYVSQNLAVRETFLNTRKSNRFIPWRVCEEELGGVPIHPGDLCQFLDLNTGEWVLEEFMGEWWFEKTRELCGNHISGEQTKNLNHSSEVQSRRGSLAYALGVGIHGLTKEGRLGINRKINERHKEYGTGRFDSELQRELANRPRSEQVITSLKKRNTEVHGGTRIYNNGVVNKRFKSHPGKEWELGSLYKWYNNGLLEDKFVRGKQPDGWERGRVKHL